jgi:hypothetical protein
MKPEAFRKMALALAGAEELEHMNHPDFRAHGRIFASLGYPDKDWGMVKLTPEQQAEFTREAGFRPCNGVWGERGATYVQLPLAKVGLVRAALKLAHENILAMPKRRKRSSGL